MGLRDDDQKGALPAGHIINSRYEVVKALGSGGMGSVYLATDQVLGERVAVKVLHADLLNDERQMQRFLREVQLMRRINQKNVVRTFDVGSDGELVYFTMEYIPGVPLEDFADKGNYPLKDIAALISGVCEGLDAIHSAGVIHRDLKPANILVVSDGTPKITDFGVARPEYSELTGHNEIVGSALYIAPEIWLGTKMTASVDLYSLGVIIYEITTGILPFEGDSPAALMRMHLEYSPPEPKSINSSIPSWLNKLTLRLLSKSSLDRPKDAHEVIEYIRLQTSSVRKDLVSEERTDDSSRFMQKLEAMNAQSVPPVEIATVTVPTTRKELRETNTLMRSESLGRTMVNRLILMAIALFLFLGGERAVFGLRRLVEPELLTTTFHNFGAALAQGQEVPSGPMLLLSAVLQILQSMVYVTFPLIFIGASAGNPRAMNRFIKRTLVVTFGMFLLLLLAHLLPARSFQPLTLLSAVSAATVQLAQLAYLDPFVSQFERTLLDEGMLLSAVGMESVLVKPLYLVFQAIILIFVGLFSHRVFEPFTWRSGRAGLFVAAVLLMSITTTRMFFVPSPEPVLGFHSPHAIVLGWALVYTVVFFGTLLLRPSGVEFPKGATKRQ